MVLSSALLTQRPVGRESEIGNQAEKAVQSNSKVAGTMCTGRGLVGSERQSVVAGCFYILSLEIPLGMPSGWRG